VVSKLRETAREQAERDREIVLAAKTRELETVETRSTMLRFDSVWNMINAVAKSAG
jgi:hypothetical protein